MSYVKKAQLSPKHRKAVDNYMKGMSKRDALFHAGYSGSYGTTSANSVFGRDDVKQEIKRMQDISSKKASITLDWWLERVRAIADANLGDVLSWDEEGVPKLDYSRMSNDMKYALGSVKLRNYKMGRGDDAMPVTEMTVELQSKLKALELIGRHLGAFEDKLTINMEDDMIDKLRQGRSRAGKEADE